MSIVALRGADLATHIHCSGSTEIQTDMPLEGGWTNLLKKRFKSDGEEMATGAPQMSATINRAHRVCGYLRYTRSNSTKARKAGGGRVVKASLIILNRELFMTSLNLPVFVQNML